MGLGNIHPASDFGHRSFQFSKTVARSGSSGSSSLEYSVLTPSTTPSSTPPLTHREFSEVDVRWVKKSWVTSVPGRSEYDLIHPFAGAQIFESRIGRRPSLRSIYGRGRVLLLTGILTC